MTKETTTAYAEKRTKCPSTGDFHRYFVFKTQVDFEPFNPDISQLEKDIALTDIPDNLYEKVEYAILGCNCGSVIKERVKQ